MRTWPLTVLLVFHFGFIGCLQEIVSIKCPLALVITQRSMAIGSSLNKSWSPELSKIDWSRCGRIASSFFLGWVNSDKDYVSIASTFSGKPVSQSKPDLVWPDQHTHSLAHWLLMMCGGSSEVSNYGEHLRNVHFGLLVVHLFPFPSPRNTKSQWIHHLNNNKQRWRQLNFVTRTIDDQEGDAWNSRDHIYRNMHSAYIFRQIYAKCQWWSSLGQYTLWPPLGWPPPPPPPSAGHHRLRRSGVYDDDDGQRKLDRDATPLAFAFIQSKRQRLASATINHDLKATDLTSRFRANVNGINLCFLGDGANVGRFWLKPGQPYPVPTMVHQVHIDTLLWELFNCFKHRRSNPRLWREREE